jgi:hypothetical protein
MAKNAVSKIWGGLLTNQSGRNYSDPSKVPVDDDVPDPFAFIDQSPVALSSVRTSAPVTITGLGDESSITFTATGGTIDKNGDGNFQTSQVLANGDTMRARHTSSASLGTTVSTTVIGGGVQDTFSSITIAVLGANNVEPANYDLELVSPRASGTRPTEEVEAGVSTPLFPANHRALRAYPSLPYKFRVVSMGGSLPHTYSMTGGDWLSIDSVTGEITGTAPASGSVTPTVTVTDAEGASQSSPFTVNVTATGFKFVDASNSAGGRNGSAANPWNSFAEMYNNSAAGDIVYFRAGNYSTSLTPTNLGGKTAEFTPPGNWARIQLRADGGTPRSVAWIGYPGDAKPVFDGGYVANVSQGVLVRVIGSAANPLYFEDIIFENYYHIALQAERNGSSYEHFRGLEFRNVANSVNGANSSCIDSLRADGSPARYYVAYQDCYFHDNRTGAWKVYWQYKALVEDCRVIDNGGASEMAGHASSAGGPDVKAQCGRFEYRYSEFSNHPSIAVIPDINGADQDSGFGGNMDAPTAAPSNRASGEIRYCKFGHFDRPGLRVINMNNFAESASIFLYRNTAVGRVNIENSDTGVGPFRHYRNVYVNDTGASATAFDRITFSGTAPGTGALLELGTGEDANLAYSVAAAQHTIIDGTTLRLTGTARDEYLGQKGHEMPGRFE